MKIAAIERLCKSAKRIIIANDEERGIQWIGDGYCLYPLFKLPRLTAKNVFAIFDIPEDKQGKISFEEMSALPAHLDVEDVSASEVAITAEKLAVSWGGRCLIPFKCQSGIMMIDNRYLSVFDDEVTYYERLLPIGRSYLVAKEGMFTAGVILPYEADEKLGELLINVGEGVCVAYDNRRCGKTERDEEE